MSASDRLPRAQALAHDGVMVMAGLKETAVYVLPGRLLLGYSPSMRQED